MSPARPESKSSLAEGSGVKFTRHHHHHNPAHTLNSLRGVLIVGRTLEYLDDRVGVDLDGSRVCSLEVGDDRG